MIKAGLIGLGYWGKVVFPILKSLESDLNFKLISICDHNDDILMQYKQDFPSIKTYTDIDELLHIDELNLIFITTNLDTHYKLVKKCLMKGCHIFVEKPFVKNIDEANELIKISL